MSFLSRPWEHPVANDRMIERWTMVAGTDQIQIRNMQQFLKRHHKKEEHADGEDESALPQPSNWILRFACTDCIRKLPILLVSYKEMEDV
uniref:Uncharacterized protein n=1 Tax=Solanum lycopersicum TaxID=4081 RepID=A0A3Q7ESW1_SOLLC